MSNCAIYRGGILINFLLLSDLVSDFVLNGIARPVVTELGADWLRFYPEIFILFSIFNRALGTALPTLVDFRRILHHSCWALSARCMHFFDALRSGSMCPSGVSFEPPNREAFKS